MEGEGQESRFVADAMLGSLARKLRILGFDTVYYRSGSDAGVVTLVIEEGRVLLTADRDLASLAERRGAASILLSGKSDAARLRSLRGAAERLAMTLERGESRCAVCNGDLAVVLKSELEGKLPQPIRARHRLFYTCESCGKVYWKGSHWKKLRSYERLLKGV
jgi:uncharacterized protein with PIN domain